MKKVNKSPHPEWAIKHRIPGTELRFLQGHYYLYAVSSKYDPILKRARKITGKILGSITQKDGFIESDKGKLRKKAEKVIDVKNICSKEYGFTIFIDQCLTDITCSLKEYFPEHWQMLLIMAYARLAYQSCIKNMPLHFYRSYLSEQYKIELNDKKISLILRDIGRDREKAAAYMRSFMKAGDFVLADMTSIFSKSANINMAKKGYNSNLIFEKQINLLYIYSAKLSLPVFYRLNAGNIREVKGFKLCLEESRLSDAVVICDKGFYSKANIMLLDENKLRYIIPLKRNSDMIDYKRIEGGSIKKNNCYFKFEGRYIWFDEYMIDNKKVIIFQDDRLLQQEETDYLNRIETHPEEYTLEGYHSQKNKFGTITILANETNILPEKIYSTYKSRINIEVMFDGMKNVLENDKTYMQNEEALQGWMFINHIEI
ncbi:MAG: transposase [Patescibacteria group bacterium]